MRHADRRGGGRGTVGADRRASRPASAPGRLRCLPGSTPAARRCAEGYPWSATFTAMLDMHAEVTGQPVNHRRPGRARPDEHHRKSRRHKRADAERDIGDRHRMPRRMRARPVHQ